MIPRISDELIMGNDCVVNGHMAMKFLLRFLLQTGENYSRDYIKEVQKVKKVTNL